MSLAGVGGTIGTIVGLGITVAALGLAFEFAGQAIERTKPKSQRRKGPLVFDTRLPKGRGSVFSGNSGNSGRRSGRRNNANLFDPMGRSERKTRKGRNDFGGFGF